MAKIDYSGRMASVYGAGRRLSPEVMETWVDAVDLHLGGMRGPILVLGSTTRSPDESCMLGAIDRQAYTENPNETQLLWFKELGSWLTRGTDHEPRGVTAT